MAPAREVNVILHRAGSHPRRQTSIIRGFYGKAVHGWHPMPALPGRRPCGRYGGLLALRAQPDRVPVPVGEQAHFPQAPTGWQTAQLDPFGKVFSLAENDPAAVPKSDIKRFKPAQERRDFAQLAALRRLAAVQNCAIPLIIV